MPARPAGDLRHGGGSAAMSARNRQPFQAAAPPRRADPRRWREKACAGPRVLLLLALLAVGGTLELSSAAAALASSAPTALTEPASSVTQISAVLNAGVNPNGATVEDCHFEYGTSTSYGFNVACSSLPGSGSSPVAVSASLPGLSANTTYHFRIVASNGGGTSHGGDRTLSTPPKPPKVLTLTASAVTRQSATLNASVDPNGGEVGACEFEYGASDAYGSSVPCTALPGSGEGAVAVSAPSRA